MIIGDANGAILAYDALCLNQNFDDSISVYTDGNRVMIAIRENDEDSIK